MTGQDPSSVTRQIAELEGDPWRLIRVDRITGRPSRYRILQPQAGLFDQTPTAKCNPPQNASGRKMQALAKCKTNYSNRCFTDTDTVGSNKRTSCPIPKIGGKNGDGSDRKAPLIPSSASASENGHNGDGWRKKGEALEALSRAIWPRRPDLRTEPRLTQFKVDCRALEEFLDEAQAGDLGPPDRAVAALQMKAENLGRSTVANRMAALTAWVKKRRLGIGPRKHEQKGNI
jgi:hypothetical protein